MENKKTFDEMVDDYNSSLVKEFKRRGCHKDLIALVNLLNYADEDILNKAFIYKEFLRESDFDEETKRTIIDNVYNNYLFDRDSHILSNEILEAMEDEIYEQEKNIQQNQQSKPKRRKQ